MRQAYSMQPSAHIQSQIGMVYAKHEKWEEALEALARAEAIDPRFEMTYVYRGNIFEVNGRQGGRG